MLISVCLFDNVSLSVSLYTTTITYGVLFKASRPIYLELTCEGVYPVGEGITTGVLNWLNNMIGLVYLAIMAIPGIGEIIITYSFNLKQAHEISDVINLHVVASCTSTQCHIMALLKRLEIRYSML